MQAHEWVQTAEDVLWRRSKLGLDPASDPAAVDAALAEIGAPNDAQ
jgi:glycerol-3-phosphate dehydrogenase